MSRYRARQRTDLRRAVALFALVGVVVVAAVVLLVRTAATQIELDQDTFCPTLEGPVSVSAVLLDVTDSFSITQASFIRNRLRQLRESVPTHGMFAVYLVNDDPQSLGAPIISLCNPGDPRDASWATENPRLWRQRWEDGFDAPVSAALEQALHRESSARSPIMEQIQAVGAGLFERYPDRPRRLTIVSDFLQHSDQLSQYGDGFLPYQEFRPSPSYRSLTVDLHGVAVQLLYAVRDGQRPGYHEQFWADFILGLGATPPSGEDFMVKIPG